MVKHIVLAPIDAVLFITSIPALVLGFSLAYAIEGSGFQTSTEAVADDTSKVIGHTSSYFDNYTSGASGRFMTKMFDDDGSDLLDHITLTDFD